MRKGSVIFVLLFLVLTFMGSAVASECTDCHESVTPKIVEDFRSGAMGDDLDCSNCHGSGHNSADDVEVATRSEQRMKQGGMSTSTA
ncbi:MAG: hypothetical protein ACXQTJ_04215 [Candidatus Syntropharchaeales archaeon]